MSASNCSTQLVHEVMSANLENSGLLRRYQYQYLARVLLFPHSCCSAFTLVMLFCTQIYTRTTQNHKEESPLHVLFHTWLRCHWGCQNRNQDHLLEGSAPEYATQCWHSSNKLDFGVKCRKDPSVGSWCEDFLLRHLASDWMRLHKRPQWDNWKCLPSTKHVMWLSVRQKEIRLVFTKPCERIWHVPKFGWWSVSHSE